MNYKFLISGDCISLPKSALLGKLSSASDTEIKVLLYAAAVASEKECFDENDVCLLSGYDLTDVKIALQFWRGADVISSASAQSGNVKSEDEITIHDKPDTKPKSKKVRIERDIPVYSGEEIDKLFSDAPELPMLIDECQKVTGKTLFNMHERNKIVALYDYLGVSSEYILSVFAYITNRSNHGSKATVPYIEKTIYKLYDMGIDTDEKLREYLKFREQYDSLEGNVRRIFGLGTRPLSKKESDMIEKWTTLFAFPLDMIEYAYELMIDAIGKVSLPYANEILAKWHKAGYTTLEQAQNDEYSFKKKKEEASASATSFDTDEFFEAALKRSYDNIGKKSDN